MIYYAAIATLSLLGWLVFCLPMALRFRNKRPPPVATILYGTLTGALLVTIAFVMIFHGERNAVRGSLVFELSGMINAATATACCLWLLPSPQRNAPRTDL